MTDQIETSFVSEASLRRLKKRHAAERRFRFYGMAAIGVAVAALATLLVSIGSLAFSAASKHYITFDLDLDPAIVAPSGASDTEAIARNVRGFYSLVRDNLLETFPDAGDERSKRQELTALVTRLAVLDMAEKTAGRPALIGQRATFFAPLADDLDLYLKGRVSREKRIRLQGLRLEREFAGTSAQFAGDFATLKDAIAPNKAGQGAQPTLLISALDATGRITDLDTTRIQVEMLEGSAEQLAGDVLVRLISVPESLRNVSDQQIAWVLALKEQGRIKRRFNTDLLAKADSTYPELAGALGAVVGSVFTMIVTAMIAIPVGIFAAIYLEEFAHKSRFTDIIEVNINNLAAVPSIVFGLLGAAVFLNFFGMPRSAPLVGGIVLGLLTLPTIIIASRAALKSVPDSIRNGALAVGASKTQSVFHHVLPLAGPGILTGSIIGMARALGETAPLLLIGMVAFVAEVPSGPTDEATVLPVLIYKWSTNAERAWEPMTAAAIIILLVFMISMNAVAVLLRKRFERRW